MAIIFFNNSYKGYSKNKQFGICDDVDDGTGNTSKPAYIDDKNGGKWIATVDNSYNDTIDFYAIDNCVTFPLLANGKESKSCDGLLILKDTIAFVELKSRNEQGTNWIKDGEKQLRTSIKYFETVEDSTVFENKRAYIVNNRKPRSRDSQAVRMDRFLDETGYFLFIKARINLDSSEG